MKNHLLFLFTLAALMSCTSNLDPSMTLEIPKEGFAVAQHIPEDQTGRKDNSLYIEPRAITEDEFNTPELSTYIDSMYAVKVRTAGVGIAYSGKVDSSIAMYELHRLEPST